MSHRGHNIVVGVRCSFLSLLLWTGHVLMCESVNVFSLFCLLPQAEAISLSHELPADLQSLSVCFSVATRGGHHGVLCRGSGAGGLGRHVLQQLLPLPAVQPVRGPEQRRQPVGAERAPGGRRVSRHTGPLMDRGEGGRRKRRWRTRQIISKRKDGGLRSCPVRYELNKR